MALGSIKEVKLITGISIPPTMTNISRMTDSRYGLEVNYKERLVRVDGRFIIPFENVAYFRIEEDKS